MRYFSSYCCKERTHGEPSSPPPATPIVAHTQYQPIAKNFDAMNPNIHACFSHSWNIIDVRNIDMLSSNKYINMLQLRIHDPFSLYDHVPTQDDFI